VRIRGRRRGRRGADGGRPRLLGIRGSRLGESDRRGAGAAQGPQLVGQADDGKARQAEHRDRGGQRRA
jgi:hypothetical protein